MDVLFPQLEKYFFPIRENDFSNWEKINRGDKRSFMYQAVLWRMIKFFFKNIWPEKQVMMWSGTSNVVGEYIACYEWEQAM